ncbi:SusC/RagA family TonB-linked outer membrane protein [Spirosoma montaniterrae]|uniref:SusC/RagA family TonB-linked outer membrane protein n=1 Tax=Spirosoma montaniterrae TaxID=1178516 RepID=A0A1P9WZ05_9BACT|nr:TonB-dependent receptor [Spirosoma montaniterrae]AQG80610.1 SusC/RagA family TonB-linked outer membrane protein [Spirosoma montaniterrae]
MNAYYQKIRLRGRPLQLLSLLLFLLLPGLLFAQERTITGQVLSTDDNTPQPGINVAVKGTTRGTTTDASGNYRIAVPDGNVTLVFSSVGFTTQEVAVGNQSSVNLSLVSDNRALSEVVVVGYGTQKKSQTTGAISSVGAKEIAELPLTNARQALQGRAAGVDVIQTGSRPGGGVTVRVRARRSINASNDPLFVLDGIPLAGNIDDLNPNDIAGMEILKDASATAIYGSRGANGVIIVTTKRGKTGKSQVNVDSYYGVSSELGRIDVMDGPQFAEYKRESRRAVGIYKDANGNNVPSGVADPFADSKLFEPIELDGIAKGRTTDYQSFLLQQGTIQSHNVSVLGGSEKTQFAVSGGYFREVGIVKNQDFTRYNFRLAIDHQLNNRIRIGMTTLGAYSLQNGNDFNPYGGALQENPLGRPFDDNGNLIFLPTSDGLRTNPIAEVIPGAQVDLTKRMRMFTSLYGEWTILDGLKYRVNFGPDFTNRRVGRFTGSQTNARRGGDPTGFTTYEYQFNYTLENILTYQKTIGNHNFNLTALHSLQRDDFETGTMNVTGIPAETQQYFNLGQATIINSIGTNLEQWTLNSYMGRLNYDYNDKYLLTLTARADGSSRFGVNNKYGFFPSAAVGWNISNEPFLKGSSWIDMLKFRVSYGSTGNTAINPYQTQTLLTRTTYAFGTLPGYGYRPNTIGNPDLKWETTTTGNVGLDFSLYRGRISGSLEVYRANTRDLLLADQLPFTSGYGSVLRNVGRTRTEGVEVTVSTVNVNTPSGFKWSTDLQWARNREAIVELFNGKVDDIGNSRFIGQPITAYFDYKKIGIWQASEEAEAAKFGRRVGEIKIQDNNGRSPDGQLTGQPDGRINADDRVIIGSQVPEFTAGMTNRFSYKGFDLSFFLFARVGSTIRSGFHTAFSSLAGRYNNLDVDYWTPNNPTNEFPRPNQSQEAPVFQSTLQYFSGTFLKVRNINIGYNLPATLTNRLRMSGLRVFASAQNPFNFSEYRSKYKGIDNESFDIVNQNQSPAVKQFTVGLNAKF